MSTPIAGKIALVRPPIRRKKLILLEEMIEAPGFFTYIVRLIYCALLTPYGAEFARIRRHFCASQICWWPIDLVDDFIEPGRCTEVRRRGGLLSVAGGRPRWGIHNGQGDEDLFCTSP